MSFFDDLYSKQNNLTSELNKKRNKIQQVLPEDYNWKKYNIIAETDWLTTLADVKGASSLANDYICLSTLISNYIDINLDARFIPFINVEIITKKQEGLELVGLLNYPAHSIDNDYVEILGNGAHLIYKGFPCPANHIYGPPDSYTQFDLSYTKNAYRAEVTYTYAGSEWKILGPLAYLSVTEDVSLSPEGNQNTDEFLCAYNPSYGGSGWDKITILSSPGFTGQVHKLEHRWVAKDPPPANLKIIQGSGGFYWTGSVWTLNIGEAHIYGSYIDAVNYINSNTDPEFVNRFPYTVNPEELQTSISEIITTKSFAANNKDVFGFGVNSQVYKKIGDSWVWQYRIDWSVIDGSINPILTRSFTFEGYWIFWNPGSNRTIGIVDLGYNEYGYKQYALENLPSGDNRYWNTIKFLLNSVMHIRTNTYFETGWNQHVLLKGFKSDEIEPQTFRLLLDNYLVFKKLANDSNETSIQSYNDTYTKYISEPPNPTDSYDKVENHYLTTGTFYFTEDTNIQYKIKVSLINPYEFSARNNYDL